MKLLTIGFEYNESYHYALIHPKEKDGANHYQVTIMNGKLEQLLYGNHILLEVNGNIVLGEAEESAEKKEQYKLRKQIALALSLHLQKDVV